MAAACALVAFLISSPILLPGAAGAAEATRGGPVPAPAATFLVDGRPRSIESLKGQRVMLWLLSTWCASCRAGLEALSGEQPRLERAGLRIVTLRNFENGGFPGPPLEEFVRAFAPGLLTAPNWIFGEVTEEMARVYNRRRYPDVYFLIDEEGRIHRIGFAPALAIEEIRAFAGVDEEAP